MHDNLTSKELKSLIRSVFSLSSSDKKLAILVDIPDDKVPDNTNWQQRREIAQSWQSELDRIKEELGLEAVNLILYPNVHSNNAELPSVNYFYSGDIKKLKKSMLIQQGKQIQLQSVLATHQIVIALTEFSATAPLKLLAPQYQFRAVTMPGFSVKMIPSLKLDYEEINKRIMTIKQILDPAEGIDIEFMLNDGSTYQIHFDLRFRTAHASGGRFPNSGTAGNLPGGECYIVPYEGEKGEASQSNGILPVQFDDEIVLYEIKQNVATNIISSGHFSEIENKKLKQEPAYGNIAEVGFGILRDFGITPIGEILLDEKLGLHIAFGRSDHFGGAVGPKNFSKPENVIHIDRIYIPETQQKIHINYVNIISKKSDTMTIIKDGTYNLFKNHITTR